ncbi:MAG: hypothetical protein HYZ73_05155, partial [Elusimicrobia bacterium]|nr:hypothetical protein [Elusimicrobiota bacterium]
PPPAPTQPIPGPNWLQTFIEAIAPYGTVREIHVPAQPSGRKPDVTPGIGKTPPFVLLIQDAHRHLEAQQNIAHILRAVGEQSKVQVLVGIEGTSGPFLSDRFRQLPDQRILRKVADWCFQHELLTGPEYAGLTVPSPLLLWGVDDGPRYAANVRALRESLARRPQAEALREQLASHLESLKASAYPPALIALDRQATAFHSGQLTLGAYLAVLQSASHQRGVPPTFPHLRQFAEALAQETQLNFSKVERQRALLIGRLNRQLPDQDRQALLEASAAYRLGSIDGETYYHRLATICRQRGMLLETFPQFQAYVRYVLLTEAINHEALFREFQTFEEHTWTQLLLIPDQRVLFHATQVLTLLTRLMNHTLTPPEWEICQRRRPEVLEMLARYAPDISPAFLLPFEQFYREAEARNQALLTNLLAKMDALESDPNSIVVPAKAGTQRLDPRLRPSGMTISPRIAVLVAGGFHTPRLSQALKTQQIPYLVLAPQVTHAEDGAKYLEVFARGTTPLEQLFTGRNLTLNLPSGLATHAADSKAQVIQNTALGTLTSGAVALTAAEAPNHIVRMDQVRQVITTLADLPGIGAVTATDPRLAGKNQIVTVTFQGFPSIDVVVSGKGGDGIQLVEFRRAKHRPHRFAFFGKKIMAVGIFILACIYGIGWFPAMNLMVIGNVRGGVEKAQLEARSWLFRDLIRQVRGWFEQHGVPRTRQDQEIAASHIQQMGERWWAEHYLHRPWFRWALRGVVQFPQGDEQYHRNLVINVDNLWAMFLHVWQGGGATGIHNHAGVMGVSIPFGEGLVVDAWELAENPGGPWDGKVVGLRFLGSRPMPAGQGQRLVKGKGGSIHVVRNTTTEPKMVYEVYSPPFTHVNNPIPVDGNLPDFIPGHTTPFHIRHEPAGNMARRLAPRLLTNARRLDSQMVQEALKRDDAPLPVYTADGTAIPTAEGALRYMRTLWVETWHTQEGSLIFTPKLPPQAEKVRPRKFLIIVFILGVPLSLLGFLGVSPGISHLGNLFLPPLLMTWKPLKPSNPFLRIVRMVIEKLSDDVIGEAARRELQTFFQGVTQVDLLNPTHLRALHRLNEVLPAPASIGRWEELPPQARQVRQRLNEWGFTGGVFRPGVEYEDWMGQAIAQVPGLDPPVQSQLHRIFQRGGPIESLPSNDVILLSTLRVHLSELAVHGIPIASELKRIAGYLDDLGLGLEWAKALLEDSRFQQAMRHAIEGRRLYQKDQPEKALKAFDQAVQLYPEYPRFQNWLGAMQTNFAAQLFNDYLASANESLPPGLNPVVNQAETLLREALRRLPRPMAHEAYGNWGTLLLLKYGTQREQEAIQAYQQSIAIAEAFNPAFFESNKNLAVLYLTRWRRHHERGELTREIQALQTALSYNPWLIASRALLVGLYALQGNYQEAIPQIETVFRQYEEGDWETSEGERETPEGRAIAEEEITRFLLGRPRLYNDYGTQLLRRENLPEALAQFHRALQLAPDYGEPLSNIGYIKLLQGDAPGALEWLTKAVEVDQSAPKSHLNRAVVLWLLGRVDEMKQELGQASRLAEEQEDSEVQRAAKQVGANQSAIEIIEAESPQEVEVIFPNDPLHPRRIPVAEAIQGLKGAVLKIHADVGNPRKLTWVGPRGGKGSKGAIHLGLILMWTGLSLFGFSAWASLGRGGPFVLALTNMAPALLSWLSSTSAVSDLARFLTGGFPLVTPLVGGTDSPHEGKKAPSVPPHWDPIWELPKGNELREVEIVIRKLSVEGIPSMGRAFASMAREWKESRPARALRAMYYRYPELAGAIITSISEGLHHRWKAIINPRLREGEPPVIEPELLGALVNRGLIRYRQFEQGKKDEQDDILDFSNGRSLAVRHDLEGIAGLMGYLPRAVVLRILARVADDQLRVLVPAMISFASTRKTWAPDEAGAWTPNEAYNVDDVLKTLPPERQRLIPELGTYLNSLKSPLPSLSQAVDVTSKRRSESDELDELTLAVALLGHGGKLAVTSQIDSLCEALEVLHNRAPLEYSEALKLSRERLLSLKATFTDQLVRQVNDLGVHVRDFGEATPGMTAQIRPLMEQFTQWLRAYGDTLQLTERTIELFRLEKVHSTLERETLHVRALTEFLDVGRARHTTPVLLQQWLPGRVWETKGRQFPIEYLMDSDLPPISVNEELLHLALERVLSNAFQEIERQPLRRSSGKVTVTVRRSQDNARVTIGLSNPGHLPTEDARQLFTLNYARPSFHHGIGLPFTARAIKAMGGAMTANTLVQEGMPTVKFVITFPSNTPSRPNHQLVASPTFGRVFADRGDSWVGLLLGLVGFLLFIVLASSFTWASLLPPAVVPPLLMVQRRSEKPAGLRQHPGQSSPDEAIAAVSLAVALPEHLGPSVTERIQVIQGTLDHFGRLLYPEGEVQQAMVAQLSKTLGRLLKAYRTGHDGFLQRAQAMVLMRHPPATKNQVKALKKEFHRWLHDFDHALQATETFIQRSLVEKGTMMTGEEKTYLENVLVQLRRERARYGALNTFLVPPLINHRESVSLNEWLANHPWSTEWELSAVDTSRVEKDLPRLEGDPQLFSLALERILSNAIHELTMRQKERPQVHSKVTIRAFHEDSHLHIWVEYPGSREMVTSSLVMERIRGLDLTDPKSRHRIGLSVARRLLERIGGAITVDDGEGREGRLSPAITIRITFSVPSLSTANENPHLRTARGTRILSYLKQHFQPSHKPHVGNCFSDAGKCLHTSSRTIYRRLKEAGEAGHQLRVMARQIMKEERHKRHQAVRRPSREPKLRVLLLDFGPMWGSGWEVLAMTFLGAGLVLAIGIVTILNAKKSLFLTNGQVFPRLSMFLMAGLLAASVSSHAQSIQTLHAQQEWRFVELVADSGQELSGQFLVLPAGGEMSGEDTRAADLTRRINELDAWEELSRYGTLLSFPGPSRGSAQSPPQRIMGFLVGWNGDHHPALIIPPKGKKMFRITAKKGAMRFQAGKNTLIIRVPRPTHIPIGPSDALFSMAEDGSAVEKYDPGGQLLIELLPAREPSSHEQPTSQGQKRAPISMFILAVLLWGIGLGCGMVFTQWLIHNGFALPVVLMAEDPSKGERRPRALKKEIRKEPKLSIIQGILSEDADKVVQAYRQASDLGYWYGALEAIRRLPRTEERLIAYVLYLFDGQVLDDQLASTFGITDPTRIDKALKNLERQTIITSNGLRWRLHPMKIRTAKGIVQSLNTRQQSMLNAQRSLELEWDELSDGDQRWRQTQVLFSQTILDHIVAQTPLGRLILGWDQARPDVFRLFHLGQFQGIWERIEQRLNSSQKHLALEDKLRLLTEHREAWEKMEGAIWDLRHTTSPGRFAIEDEQLKWQLKAKGEDPTKSVALDQGARMWTSVDLQKALGGTVISEDIEDLDPPTAPNVQFVQGDMTHFRKELAGQINVIRHANVLRYLDPEAFDRTVQNVFEYAKARGGGLLYHVGKSVIYNPVLFDQLIFDIGGHSDADWKLVYVGYLSAFSAKEHNPQSSLQQLVQRERALSSQVLAVREKALEVLDHLYGGSPEKVQDRYGRVLPKARDRLLHALFSLPPRTVNEELMEEILRDLLRISPWTRPSDYLGGYWRDQRVMVPYDAGWEFVEAPRDLHTLLAQLLKHLERESQNQFSVGLLGSLGISLSLAWLAVAVLTFEWIKRARTHPETLLGLQPREGGLRRRQARSAYRSVVKYAVARLPGLGAPPEASARLARDVFDRRPVESTGTDRKETDERPTKGSLEETMQGLWDDRRSRLRST